MSYSKEEIQAKHAELDAIMADFAAKIKEKKKAVLAELVRLQELENAEAEIAAAQKKIDNSNQTISANAEVLNTIFGNAG